MESGEFGLVKGSCPFELVEGREEAGWLSTLRMLRRGHKRSLSGNARWIPSDTRFKPANSLF